jgi:quercetin dioxygenase-like cupin family protein
MQKLSLQALAREQQAAAQRSSAARSARTVFGGHEHALRQTVIALRADASLDEHENPGEATLLVLSGKVELRSGDDHWQGSQGDLLIIPDAPHSLHALVDAAVLLSVVPRAHRQS